MSTGASFNRLQLPLYHFEQELSSPASPTPMANFCAANFGALGRRGLAGPAHKYLRPFTGKLFDEVEPRIPASSGDKYDFTFESAHALA